MRTVQALQSFVKTHHLKKIVDKGSVSLIIKGEDMRIINTLAISIITMFICACETVSELTVSLNVKDSTIFYLNERVDLNVFAAEYVETAVVSLGEEYEWEVEVNAGSGVFEFTPPIVGSNLTLKIEGYDSDMDLRHMASYQIEIIRDIKVTVSRPVSGETITVGEEFSVTGMFEQAVKTMEILQDGRLFASIKSSPFDESFIFDSGRGNSQLSFLFKDEQGDILRELNRSVFLINGDDDSSSDIPLFNRTWEDPQTAIVIDAYEGNGIDWDEMKTDPRVVGVIHRSGDGLRVDSKYAARRKTAREYGYLWGAYHLGRPGNVERQADLFLKTVGDDPETLLILDIESTSSSSMMNIEESVEFVNYIYKKTGRIPVIYANHSATVDLTNRLANNALFQRAPLWYARFRSDIPVFPTGLWDRYFLWQFSSEINCSRTGTCLYNVPGTSFDMDINVFAGNESELRRSWFNPQ